MQDPHLDLPTADSPVMKVRRAQTDRSKRRTEEHELKLKLLGHGGGGMGLRNIRP